MARLTPRHGRAEAETTRLFLLLLVGALLAAGVTFAALGLNHRHRLSQAHDFTPPNGSWTWPAPATIPPPA